MSRHKEIASTTASAQDSHFETLYDPRTESFLHSCMGRFAMTREEVIEKATQKYGALEFAVKSKENTEARVKAAMERAHSHGLGSSQLQIEARARERRHCSATRI